MQHSPTLRRRFRPTGTALACAALLAAAFAASPAMASQRAGTGIGQVAAPAPGSLPPPKQNRSHPAPQRSTPQKSTSTPKLTPGAFQ